MPSHRAHLFVDLLLLNKNFLRLHVAIDFPVRLFGPWHRKYFHTIQEVIEFARILFPFDSDAVFSGRIHIWLDKECSRDRAFKKLLESEAKRYEDWIKKNLLIFGEFKSRIAPEDLMLRFFESNKEDQLRDSKFRNKPKKKSKRRKKVAKKRDEFFEWVKLYKGL